MMTSAFSRAGVEFTQDEVSVFMDKIADKQADCKRWAKRLFDHQSAPGGRRGAHADGQDPFRDFHQRRRAGRPGA